MEGDASIDFLITDILEINISEMGEKVMEFYGENEICVLIRSRKDALAAFAREFNQPSHFAEFNIIYLIRQYI